MPLTKKLLLWEQEMEVKNQERRYSTIERTPGRVGETALNSLMVAFFSAIGKVPGRVRQGL